MHTADDTLTLDERVAPPLDRGQRAFRFALLTALLVHAAIFIEVGRSVPRAVGDKSGASDAIAVEIVSEADLRSTEAVASPPAGAPPPPAAEVPQPTPPEPQPEAAEPAPPEVAAKETPKQETPKQETSPAEFPDFETLVPDLATTPQPKDEPAEKPPEETKAAEAKPEPVKPPKKAAEKKAPAAQARLTPQDFDAAPPGRSAGATRPPGITRSGENDDFGIAVIRALRQTMPPPRGLMGRVTVRLILTENGDLGQVIMLEPSGSQLDTDVVFAAKQTYFPLPPYKSTVADRTFTITYVYQ
ncbi:MAG: energy transducer TonB [Hyphomicrobium sp.]|uniref:energy transducer TonB family protein n=1 Tax=Hyphomicrobium sp. TaxID=82 RepID=UPI003D0EAD04